MAYGLRHQISYYRKSGGRTTIDILEKDYAGAMSTLTAADNPLEISFEGDMNNIYKPSIGIGATIRIFATPLSMDHLFTTDPQKYMVKIFNGGSEESSGADDKLIWQGFINTGIFTESYSTPISLQHNIVIECNDGLSILSELDYRVTVGGANYTGYSTIGAVMKNIFSKLGLEFLAIRTATDLEYDGHTNLFTALSVNNENYYDEQGRPMSCRDVLDCIFGGMGLVLSLRGDKIYIVDPIHLHQSFSASKEYATHPTYGATESVIGFGGYLDIASASSDHIDWYETGQVRDIVQPFNDIDVTYDPYTFTEKGYNFNEEGNADNNGTYGTFTDNGITYNVYTDVTMAGWTLNGVNKFEGIEETAPDTRDIDYYIKQTTDGTGTFEYTFPYSNIQQDNNLMLEVSMDVYVNTRHQSNIIDPDEAATTISSLYLQNLQIKVGSKYYKCTAGLGSWYDTAQDCWLYVRELDAEIIPAYYYHYAWYRKPRYYAAEDTSEINDKWVTAHLYVPLSEVFASGVSLVNGSISIIIPKALSSSVVTGVLNVLIKNVNVQVINAKKEPINNDGILFNGKQDSSLSIKKADLDLHLRNGIGPYGSSKGAYCSSEAPIAGLNITGLSRVDSVEHKSSELLLQNLLSQYNTPRFQLKGTLDVADYMDTYTNVLEILFHLLKDTGHLGEKAFYMVSGTYTDREECLETEMVELTSTREDIS